MKVEDLPLARAAARLRPERVAAEVRHNGGHADALPPHLIVCSIRELVRVTRFGGNVVWFEDGVKGRGRGKAYGMSSLKDGWLHHIRPKEAYTMSCSAQISCVDQNWRP